MSTAKGLPTPPPSSRPTYSLPPPAAASPPSDVAQVPVEQWTKLIHEHANQVKELEKSYDVRAARYQMNCQFEAEQVHNTVGQTIVEAAQRFEADFVVMGTRGLGTVRRTMLGSVSDYVLHHSSVPVMVCPSKNTAPQHSTS